jgi:hypothetical protein
MTNNTYIDSISIQALMNFNPKTKGILIAVAVCSLAVASILSGISSFVKPVSAVAWCDNQKGKDHNWKDGCTSGVSDCRGGKSYNPGSGHTRQFHLGYDAGYTHVCGYR